MNKTGNREKGIGNRGTESVRAMLHEFPIAVAPCLLVKWFAGEMQNARLGGGRFFFASISSMAGSNN